MMRNMELPKVAIIGRPNVGKSTLFNRILKKRIAIIENIPGVTRDRIEEEVEWNGKKFILIDTGGKEISLPDPAKGDVLYSSLEIIKEVQKQIDWILKKADVFIFLLDVKSGIVPDDKEVANYLRKTNKPIIFAVNKVDNKKLEERALQFYEIGPDKIFSISSIMGKGIGDLLDEVVKHLPSVQEQDLPEKILQKEEIMKIAIVGHPNVGKSSILNALVGEERMIVDAEPGTTRDSVDTKLKKDEKEYILIDTAGIRKKKKVKEQLEYYSVIRAKMAIKRCDVATLIIDAVLGVVEQDKKIAEFITSEGKGIVIVVNKWDLIMARKKKPGQKKITHDYISAIKRELQFVHYAPIIFTSAKTMHGINKILTTTDLVFKNYTDRIETSELNKVLREIISKFSPPSSKEIKIYYITQVKVKPPTFVFFTNYPEEIGDNYIKFLENKIRKNFKFEGTPIKILLRKR